MCVIRRKRIVYVMLYVWVYLWFKIWLATTEWCECICMLFMYVCMYRMTNQRLEVRIFFSFKRPIPLSFEIIRPMLILLNYGLKLLKRRWYTHTFHVNPLTHVDALSSITFYSSPYYFLCDAYCYSLWLN